MHMAVKLHFLKFKHGNVMMNSQHSKKSRPSVLQRCRCSGSHVVVATCPTGHPLHKQLRCIARHALPEGLRICYAGDAAE